MWLIIAMLLAQIARGLLFLLAPTPPPAWSTVAWFVANGGLETWSWFFLGAAVLGFCGILGTSPWQRASGLFPSLFLALLTVSSLVLSDQWTMDAVGNWRRWMALTWQGPVVVAYLLSVIEYVARGTPWGHRLALYRHMFTRLPHWGNNGLQ